MSSGAVSNSNKPHLPEVNTDYSVKDQHHKKPVVDAAASSLASGNVWDYAKQHPQLA